MRVHHEEKTNGVTVHLEKKKNGVGVHHEKDQWGESSPLFFTTLDLNILLHMLYVPSQHNQADALSRRLSFLDYTLTSEIWIEVQLRFGVKRATRVWSDASRLQRHV